MPERVIETSSILRPLEELKREAQKRPVETNLSSNKIGPIGNEGARALTEAIRESQTPVTLNLGYNNIGDEGAKALTEAIRESQTPVTLDLRYTNTGDEIARALAHAIKNPLIREQIERKHTVNEIKEFLSTVPCKNRGVLCGAIANHTLPELTEEKINKYLGGYTPSVSKEQASKILAMTLFYTAEGPFKDIPPEIREVLLSKIEDGYLEDLVMEVYKEIKDANSNSTAVGGASDGEGNMEVAATDDNPDDNSGGGAEKNSDGEASDSLSSDSNAESQESSNATTNIFYAETPKELVLRLVDTVEELSGKETKEYEESIQELESEEGLANVTFSQFPELDIPGKPVEIHEVLGGMVSVGS